MTAGVRSRAPVALTKGNAALDRRRSTASLRPIAADPDADGAAS